MSQIPYKIAAVCCVSTIFAMVITNGEQSVVALLAVSLGVSLVVFAAVRGIVSRRLAVAEKLIGEIREPDEDVPIKTLKGDEIDNLIAHITSVNDSVKNNLDALRKMESYRKDFLGDISHELKTPIFAVRGFAETLIDGAIDDPGVRISFLEKIVQNADRLGSLAEDLNAITRIQTGELKMEKVTFNIGSTVRDVVSQLEPMAKGEEVKLTYRIGPVDKPVFGDPVRIHQVVRNLAENAIKYTGSGGFTEIVVRQIRPSIVRVSVIDNGIGISEEHIERITERFFRVERSRSRGLGGTGLGLAIVKHILAAHDQKLKVESTVGIGSTFAFDLALVSHPESEAVTGRIEQ